MDSRVHMRFPVSVSLSSVEVIAISFTNLFLSHWKKRLHFSRRSKLILFVILIFSVVLNVPRYWEMELHERHLIVTSLRFQFWYKVIQEGVIYATIVYGGPLVGLAVINYRTLQLVRADKVWFLEKSTTDF